MKRKRERSMCENFNCSTLFEMKIKQSISGEKAANVPTTLRKDANKATRESILNSEGSTCYPSTTREL